MTTSLLLYSFLYQLPRQPLRNHLSQYCDNSTGTLHNPLSVTVIASLKLSHITVTMATSLQLYTNQYHNIVTAPVQLYTISVTMTTSLQLYTTIYHSTMRTSQQLYHSYLDNLTTTLNNLLQQGCNNLYCNSSLHFFSVTMTTSL